MGYKYAVIGAGRQGIAAAYDMGRFGDAEEIILVDSHEDIAQTAAMRINKLLAREVARGVPLDIMDLDKLEKVLQGTSSLLSAVPYEYNLYLTELAISLKSNMCDLGGNTEIVRKQLSRNSDALEAGITIVPDCGMGPGLNISLAMYAISLVDRAKEVFIWDGGLPQNPKPPWNYLLTFNFNGLANEYYGNAYFLRDGKVTEVECFNDFEELDFPPPLGRLEAFVTSGGLSTAPWTLEGKLDRLENKTLRYPGHWAQFRAFSQLGLLSPEPVKEGGIEFIPRHVLGALLEPKIVRPEIKDVCVILVKCIGEKNGEKAEVFVELVDNYDERTGFTSMQRLTGWHASIVAILAAKGRLSPGAIPVELAIPGITMVEEARKRGLKVKERFE
ncbi:MAG: saccharopine dehydrogenase C-terminal domain-containing protein [Candidatus Thermoplasmatota archaeon]|jgi:lysine 6-dehydrogenase|nr:saccharopine dehydrogenase C-terminal domain-containing protein [Candidatus Thermoplasmatota archaeon]MDP7265693.1 saccharopine dehydrogenase C-terminal domain-containing protein [Candidatus Thermoplasmatota archaeon]